MSIEAILVAIFAIIDIKNKPLLDFFTEYFELKFSIFGRHGYLNLGRFSKYNESTFRRRSGEFFDWLSFNAALIGFSGKAISSSSHIAALDCSFISKSGKKTFGLDSFWSGCHQKAKRGLEISVLSVINVATRKAWTLDVTQTPSGLSQKESSDAYSRIDFYIEQILDCLSQLVHIQYFVADGYYAKRKIFNTIVSVNKHLITKLRCDANLMFRFEGEHPKRKGAKSKYNGKATFEDLSRWHKAGKDTKYEYLEIYYHVCYSPCFDRWLMVVLVHNTKTKQYALLASTDLEQAAQQVLSYYQLRFQIEFLFRDAKQFMGLNHCQARDEQKLDFHFNACMSALNIVNIQHELDDKALSINNLIRRMYNQKFIENLLSQLSLKPELKIFNQMINEIINSAVKWGQIT